MLKRYSAYGLLMDSAIDLPELTLVSSVVRAEPAHLTINVGDVSPHGLEGGRQCGPCHWISESGVWLQIPDVCRFLIEGGDRITIDPEPGADDDSIRLFLLGSAIGAVLFQRGYLVLHGNSIRVGERCMICVGDSGAGKSSLAAGFMQRGYDILADDVVPIDDAGRAIPGFPRIKIWQDVADRLGLDTQGLRRIRPGMDKYNFPLAQRWAASPLPVRWIYVLSSHAQSTVTIEPIDGMNRFEPLLANTYRNFYLDGMALKPRHLQLCGKLAGQIHLAKVSRPREGFKLDALMDALLEHISQNP